VVQLYEKLRQAGYDVLIDDRDLRPGAKFADADLCGFPWQLIVGPRGVEAGSVEVKRRASGERQEVAFDSLLDYLEAAQPRSSRPAR
jgi:prolyl-tRNA synthetase